MNIHLTVGFGYMKWSLYSFFSDGRNVRSL